MENRRKIVYDDSRDNRLNHDINFGNKTGFFKITHLLKNIMVHNLLKLKICYYGWKLFQVFILIYCFLATTCYTFLYKKHVYKKHEAEILEILRNIVGSEFKPSLGNKENCIFFSYNLSRNKDLKEILK